MGPNLRRCWSSIFVALPAPLTPPPPHEVHRRQCLPPCTAPAAVLQCGWRQRSSGGGSTAESRRRCGRSPCSSSSRTTWCSVPSGWWGWGWGWCPLWQHRRQRTCLPTLVAALAPSLRRVAGVGGSCWGSSSSSHSRGRGSSSRGACGTATGACPPGWTTMLTKLVRACVGGLLTVAATLCLNPPNAPKHPCTHAPMQPCTPPIKCSPHPCGLQHPSSSSGRTSPLSGLNTMAWRRCSESSSKRGRSSCRRHSSSR